MIEISCRAVVLDIEGTVSPVAFVYDEMFPFARRHVAAYLRDNWDEDAVRQTIDLLAVDLGQSDSETWFVDQAADQPQQRQDLVVRSVHELMDQDAKVTGLKQLQGLIWRSGFESGQLVASLFPDVPARLQAWHQSGLSLYIYSSGSIAAQKLFFGHTGEGDLLDLFSGFFDTTTGNKKEPGSYTAIIAALAEPPELICFVSDVTAELDAARQAGMQTVLRPADGRDGHDHPVIASFEELSVRPAT